MTYHHFVNVAALAFAPYWIFYKARISAQRETKSILVGAGFYVMAQFLELITLATFVSGGGERQPTEQAAGSLLHILQVNLRFSSSRRLHRDLVTSFFCSRGLSDLSTSLGWSWRWQCTATILALRLQSPSFSASKFLFLFSRLFEFLFSPQIVVLPLSRGPNRLAGCLWLGSIWLVALPPGAFVARCQEPAVEHCSDRQVISSCSDSTPAGLCFA